MLEKVRRKVSHARVAGHERALNTAERNRRLSYIRMKRFQARQAAEDDLLKQTQEEIGSLEKARKSLRERKLAERELRRMKPSVARKIVKDLTTVAKAPFRIARAGVHPKGSRRLQNLVFGTPGPIFPKSQSVGSNQDLKNFLYGSPKDWL